MGKKWFMSPMGSSVTQQVLLKKSVTNPIPATHQEPISIIQCVVAINYLKVRMLLITSCCPTSGPENHYCFSFFKQKMHRFSKTPRNHSLYFSYNFLAGKWTN